MCNIGETHTTNEKEIEKETYKKVDDSGGAHCMSSTVVVNSSVHIIERSNRNVRITKKKNEKKTEKKRKIYHKGSRDEGDADSELYRL